MPGSKLMWLISKSDPDTTVQKGQLTEPLGKDIEMEFDICEGLIRGDEMDFTT